MAKLWARDKRAWDSLMLNARATKAIDEKYCPLDRINKIALWTGEKLPIDEKYCPLDWTGSSIDPLTLRPGSAKLPFGHLISYTIDLPSHVEAQPVARCRARCRAKASKSKQKQAKASKSKQKRAKASKSKQKQAISKVFFNPQVACTLTVCWVCKVSPWSA